MNFLTLDLTRVLGLAWIRDFGSGVELVNSSSKKYLDILVDNTYISSCHCNEIAELVFVYEESSPSSCGEKEDLDEGVVPANKVGEEVQVPANEHQQTQELGFAGDNRKTSGLPNLQWEPNYSKHMNQVSENAENVHLI